MDSIRIKGGLEVYAAYRRNAVDQGGKGVIVAGSRKWQEKEIKELAKLVRRLPEDEGRRKVRESAASHSRKGTKSASSNERCEVEDEEEKNNEDLEWSSYTSSGKE